MSLVTSFVDGLLLRWPILLPPRARESTRSPAPRKPFPTPAPTYERRLWGSDNFDRFEDQRFRSEPRRAAPIPTPVKTFGGFGATHPFASQPNTGFIGGAHDFGNLPVKVPTKTFDVAEKIPRTPIKTF